LKKIDDAFIQSVFAVQILFSGLFRIRQQLKTFRLKHVFLARKIIRSARYVVIMKNAWHNLSPKIFRTDFLCNWDSENVSEYSVLRNLFQKYMQNDKNNAKLNKAPGRK
jgi:hypothetical protein